MNRVRPLPISRRKAAFTMLELLVVVVIAAIVAALAVPSFVQSFRSAKLKTSARSLVMTHRYARGQAVLRQQPVALLLHADAGRIEVVSMEREQPATRADQMAAGMTESIAAELGTTGQRTVASTSRMLEEGIVFERIAFEDERPGEEGVWRVRYQPNGMGETVRVTLLDDRGQRLQVVLDALSGGARVEGP